MKIIWCAAGGVLLTCLGACQSMDGSKDKALSVVPVEDVRHGFARPEAMYAIGRYLQGQLLYDQAIVAYRRLLDAFPAHPEARNALGLIYAAQGRYDAAIAEFEIAVKDAPNSASIANNLGYAYLLQGRLAQATAVLNKARQLEPGNRRVLDNLEMAQARAATLLAAAPLPVPAPAPEKSVVPAATLLAAVSAAAPATAPAKQPEPEAAVSAAQSAPATVVAAATEEKPGRTARLEVSNANGINGLARSTSQQLVAAGYSRARLTNEPPYRLTATQIEYRRGYEPQAQTLQAVLRRSVPVVESAALRYDVQLRLVLGRDTKSPADVLVN